MDGYPKLNLPDVSLRLRRAGGAVQVWDPLRGMWLVLTPEEWVRRHLIGLLTGCCGVQPLRIAQEYPVPLNGQPQRADVVVADAAARPLLLAECKAPDVKITRATLRQAVRYNSVVGARYLLLTNGRETYCYECVAPSEYRPLPALPHFGGAAE